MYIFLINRMSFLSRYCFDVNIGSLHVQIITTKKLLYSTIYFDDRVKCNIEIDYFLQVLVSKYKNNLLIKCIIG